MSSLFDLVRQAKEAEQAAKAPFDFSKLTDPNDRATYFGDTLAQGHSKTDPVYWSLHRLLQYIQHLSWGLHESGMGGNEAVKLASDVVFGGLRDYLEAAHNHAAQPSEWAVPRLQGMDQLIRVAHAIEPAIQPLFHEDPIVASFYEQLGDALEHHVPNHTYSPYGGYVYIITLEQ